MHEIESEVCRFISEGEVNSDRVEGRKPGMWSKGRAVSNRDE